MENEKLLFCGMSWEVLSVGESRKTGSHTLSSLAESRTGL